MVVTAIVIILLTIVIQMRGNTLFVKIETSFKKKRYTKQKIFHIGFYTIYIKSKFADIILIK
jgi:hypothetical protein